MLDFIDLLKIEKIAKDISVKVMDIYNNSDFKTQIKKDNSPVTVADKQANEYICKQLYSMYENIPIISEENELLDYEKRKNWDYFWLIDPIDGTKEFINKNGEFTINIALIHKSKPVLGVVYAPVFDMMFSAKKGLGAFFNGIKIKTLKNNARLKVFISRSHMNEQTQKFIDKLSSQTQTHVVKKGSSLKLCLIAMENNTIYPKLGLTYEWDTAAAHAILKECNKDIYKFDSSVDTIEYLDNNIQKKLTSLKYNKRVLNNDFFVAV